ncbi:MAG: redoxin domain-containing protein [Armatimonadetes bacterium]|nr:redoxin domain-containing protein [Armatimonadota bacterium]
MKTSFAAFVLTACISVALVVSPRACGAAAEGFDAPSFSLKDQNGRAHALSDYKGQWVVLAFYPADMTPGCTLENRSLRDSNAQLKKLNAVTLAVSVQDSASHARFCEAEKLTQTLLADTEGSVARSWGVLGDNGLARRVTFIINPQGRIARVMDKVNVQTHGEDVVAEIRRLQQAGPEPTVYKPRTRGIKPLKAGETAPLFSLPEVGSGKVVALSDLRHGHKGVLVVWVSVQCPVSNAYQGRLNALKQKYAESVAFVAIDSNSTETQQQIEKHFAPPVLGFAVLRDVENVVANDYGARVTPEAFLIDKDGIVRYHGAVDDSQDPAGVQTSYLDNALKAFVTGDPIVPTDTRAFGCSIQRVRK